MITNLTLILTAIIMIESGGDNFAKGDYGLAKGALQIHRRVVVDVNRIAKTNYTHDDAFDRKKAVHMFTIYVRHYASPSRLGRKPTFRDIACIWNGGPNGYKQKQSTYWQLVRARLPNKK